MKLKNASKRHNLKATRKWQKFARSPTTQNTLIAQSLLGITWFNIKPSKTNSKKTPKEKEVHEMSVK